MEILDAMTALRSDLSNLMPILKQIRILLKPHKNEITLKGKTLRTANVEQPSQFGYYDEIRVHLQSLSDFIDIKLAQKRAEVIKMISEHSSLDYGERTKDKMVEGDPAYTKIRMDKLEVDEVLELTKSVCKQFEQRGYTLNNLTKLVVAQAQDDSLILD